MRHLEDENKALRERLSELESSTVTTATKEASNAEPRQVAVAAKSDGGSAGGRDEGMEVSRSSLGKAGMTAGEIARYSRHLLVPAVGVEGQRCEDSTGYSLAGVVRVILPQDRCVADSGVLLFLLKFFMSMPTLFLLCLLFLLLLFVCPPSCSCSYYSYRFSTL